MYINADNTLRTQTPVSMVKRRGQNTRLCASIFLSLLKFTLSNQCEPGSIPSSTPPGNCIVCARNTYADWNAVTGTPECKQCYSGMTTIFAGASSSSACLCPAGEFRSRPGATFCSSCEFDIPHNYDNVDGEGLTSEAGTVMSDGSFWDLCYCDTARGYKNKVLGNGCEQCPGGSMLFNFACTLCEAGKYHRIDAQSSSCHSCPSGSVSAEGAVVCSACAAGEYSEAGVTCKSCREYDVNTNSTSAASGPESCHCIAGFTGIVGACISCEAGKFKPNIGTQACQDCGVLQFQALNGASSCSICPAAHVRVNAKTCTACSRGKYKTTAGSNPCITCDPPFFTDQVASRSCDVCGAGSDRVDAQTCRTCAVGKYTTKAGQSPCKECTPTDGVAVNVGAVGCVPCKIGEFWSNSGLCQQCPPGQYLNNNDICTVCTAVGADYCAKMLRLINSFAWDPAITNEFIQKCPGNIAAYAFEETICEHCGCSVFHDAITENTVNTCDIRNRHYLDGVTRECQFCPSNRNINNHPAHRSCDTPNDRLLLQLWNETVAAYHCVAGYFHVNAAEGCQSCAVGKYQDTAGQNTCLQCPGGTTTRGFGSISVQDCAFCSFDHRLEQSLVDATFSCEKCEPCTTMRHAVHMENTCATCGFYDYDKSVRSSSSKNYGAACILTHCLGTARTDDFHTELFENIKPKTVNDETFLSTLYIGAHNYAPPGFDNIFKKEELKWWKPSADYVVPTFENNMESPHPVYISFVDFYFRIFATMISSTIKFNSDTMVTTWNENTYLMKVREIVAIYNKLDTARLGTLGLQEFPQTPVPTTPDATLGSRQTSITFNVPPPGEFELQTGMLFFGEYLTTSDCGHVDMRCRQMFVPGTHYIKFDAAQNTITFADLSRFVLEDISFDVRIAWGTNPLNFAMKYLNSNLNETVMTAELHWQRLSDPVYRGCADSDSVTKYASITDPWAFSQIRNVFHLEMCASLNYA